MAERSEPEAKNQIDRREGGNGPRNEPKEHEENFMFMPLSEGLGFERKASDLELLSQSLRDGGRSGATVATEDLERRAPSRRPASSRPERPPAEKSLTELLNQLPPSLDFVDELAARSALRSPAQAAPTPVVVQPLTGPGLGRPAANAAQTSPTGGAARSTPFPAPGTKAGAAVPLSPSRPIDNRSQKRSVKSAVAAAPMNPQLQVAADEARETGTEIPVNFAAAFVDLLIVAGFAILCLVSIVVVTNANLVGLLTSTSTDVSAKIHLGLLFLFVLHFYLLVSRSFFGASVGEWAFETGLGTQTERARLLYPLRVLWRTALCTGTLFVLPVLSWALGRDLLGILSGVRLERRPE